MKREVLNSRPDDERHLLSVHGGHVFYGCRAWEPRFDLTYGRQGQDGRWKLGRGRRGKKCICAGRAKEGWSTPGSPNFCEACTLSGQEDKIPIPRVKPPDPSEPTNSPPIKLTRRERRRMKQVCA